MGQALTEVSFDIGQFGYDSFLEITKYLNVRDIPSISRVCKAWNDHAGSNDLWRHFAKRDLSPLPKSEDISWREFYRLNAPGRGIRKAHYCNSLIFSGWGRTIAIWSRPGPQTAAFQGTFLTVDHSAPIGCMSIQARGRHVYLLTGSQDKTIKVWQKCGENHEIKLRSTLQGHESAVTSLAGLRDLIFSGSEDGEIGVWKRDPLSLSYLAIERIAAHAAQVTALAIDAAENRNRLFSGSKEGEIKVFRLDGDTLFEGMTISDMHTQAITSLVYHQRQKELYSSSDDGTVRIWKIHAFAMQCVFLLPLQESPIKDIFPYREGNFFLTASSQGTLKRWNRVRQPDPERIAWEEEEGPPLVENKSVISIAAIKAEGPVPAHSVLAMTSSGITACTLRAETFFRHRRIAALQSYL